EAHRLGHRHAESARLERAGRVLPLVLGPEMPEPEMRGEARKGQKRCAALAQRYRLFAVREGQELAEAVHASRSASQFVLAERRGHARQVVANGEHLTAPGADGEELARRVTMLADRAFDVAHEGHVITPRLATTGRTAASANDPPQSSIETATPYSVVGA